MIVRTQVSFIATGEHFTPSKVPTSFSASHDPGVIGERGRYRGVPVPYGSAAFHAPEEEPEKIAHIHRLAIPFLRAMREAGAEDFSLRITYQYDSQCALSFTREEQKMICELDCDFCIDCWTDESPIQPPQRNAGSRPSSDDSPASETPSSLGPRG